MQPCTQTTPIRPARRKAAFTLAELLVVIGVIALLVALMASPLQLARRQAMQTHCARNLQQIGVALENAMTSYGFYPIWDDGGTPTRYTWLDVLVQDGLIGNARAGYCPEDDRPDPLSRARGAYYGVRYPGAADQYGIDYSYGIGVPLSAGGWAWRPGLGRTQDLRARRFPDYLRNASQRVLAADATWSAVYNLGGEGLRSYTWNQPTQYDNTVAYLRHPGAVANLLKQDGHVSRVRYQFDADEPVSTAQHFVWHRTEPLNVGPDDQYQGNYYPDAPPLNVHAGNSSDVYPTDLNPHYYTNNILWTRILHK